MRLKSFNACSAIRCALFFAAAMFAGEAVADVAYSNFGDGQSFLIGGRGVGAFDPPLVIAMPFTVEDDVFLDEVSVAVAHDREFPSNALNVSVYNTDSAGNPDSPLESILITGVPTTFGIVSAYSSLHPRIFAGHDYWVVLSSQGRFFWGLTPLGQSGFRYSTDGGVSWMTRAADVAARRSAFSVAGYPVPEPTALALLAVLCSISVVSFRRR